MNKYVKVPDVWLRVLASRSAAMSDYRIGLELLALARFSPVVKFTNERARKLGISVNTRLRSLDRLEHWGLIRIKRRIGRTMWIRVLWLSGKQPSDTASRLTPPIGG